LPGRYQARQDAREMNSPWPARLRQVTPVRRESQLKTPRRQVVPYRWFANTGTWVSGE
jgi:hypothetical protein